MSKFDYDLDSSGGLMPQIQQLIKFADEDTNKLLLKKELHSYYKRPGRGHNHDSCDACQEGGDLICCDKCPASFHLGCHDPPLYEEDIPMGIWLCHNCRMTQKVQNAQEQVEIKLENIVRANTPTQAHANNESESLMVMNSATIAKRKLRNRSNSRMSQSSENSVATDKSNRLIKEAIIPLPQSQQQEHQQQQHQQQQQQQQQLQQPQHEHEQQQEQLNNATNDSTATHRKASPLDELIRAAAIMNPRQFELPREMEIYVQFPGTDKIEPTAAKNCAKKLGKNNSKTKPHELDAQGLVPLPAKTCFYCRKSCKKAPLIACDYCPLYFHQDCLDPPMTALPTGLWMCPNHPEQFIDWKLVSSASATERIKLWNRFAGPVDQDTVKAEFFRKVHSKNPPFRYKVKNTPRERVQIPAMIDYHYKNPPSLLPSLRDVLRCEAVYKSGQSNELIHEDLSQIVEDELKALQEAGQKIVNFNSSDDFENQTFDVEMTSADDIQIVDNEIEVQSTPNDCEPSIAAETTGDVPALRSVVSLQEMITIPSNDSTTELLLKADQELKCLDVPLIKLLAFQRLQQIINENSDLVWKCQRETATKAIHEALIRHPTATMALPSQLLTKEDIERIARKFSSTEDVSDGKRGNSEDGDAVMRAPSPTEHKNDNDHESEVNRIKRNHFYYGNGFDELKTDEEKARVIAGRIEEPILKSKIRVRAALTPVSDILSGKRWFTRKSMDGIVFMRYRSLKIGSGPGNDLNLSEIGRCAHISSKHATIFFDEITQSYELLNYSEFGTEVNGFMYSCDFTEHPKMPGRQPTDDPKAFYENVRNIIDKRRGVNRPMVKLDETLRMAAPDLPQCKCMNKPSPMSVGWEGTAILGHGTLIRFGCLAFVFSICEPNPTVESR